MELTLKAAGLISFLTGVLLYVNTLDCGFCYDDKAAILDNKDLLPSSSWSKLWSNDFWGTPLHSNLSHKSYRPLCVATFKLNYLLHELEPMGYHLVNILLHGVVCYLYVQLCGLVLSGVWPALVAGLLFAVHPIHTEAVAGVVGRADLMAALLFTSSLLTYHKSVTSQPGSSGWLVCSMLLSLCSLLSKETGLTVTGVCLVYDYFLLHKNTISSTLTFLQQIGLHSKPYPTPGWVSSFMRRTLMMGVFTCGVLCWRLGMSGAPPNFNSKDNEALLLDSPYRQLHWAYMTFVNSELLVNPSRLIHDYRMSAIPLITSLTDYRNILTVLTLTLYAGLGLHSLHATDLFTPTSTVSTTDMRVHSNGYHLQNNSTPHKNGLTKHVANGKVSNGIHYHYHCRVSHHHGYSSKHVLLFGLTLLVIPFLPASNMLFPVGFVVAERVLYLPSMGLCLLVAHGMWTLMKHFSRSHVLKVLLISLLLTHCAKTLMRNRDWHSKISIYRSLLRHFPSNGNILANLAREYRNAGQFDKAEDAYRMGMAVAPNVSINFINLGSMLKAQERYSEAEQVLSSAVEVVRKTHDDNSGMLANLYISLSSLVSKSEGRLEEALELVDKGLTLNKSLSSAHNTKGSLLLRMGRQEQAVMEYKRALEVEPTYTNALYNLALVYKQKGELLKSVKTLESLLKIDSSHQLAHGALHKLRQSLHH